MNTDKAQSPTDKALAKIADLIVKRMEELKGEQWQKPWFSTTYQGRPQNITGRSYNGMNHLILDMATISKGHDLPVFLTFNQASKEGVRVNKGASSIPVLYYERIYKDEHGNTIPENQVKAMSLEEKAQIRERSILKKFDVFNIDDTNFKQVKPERYDALKKQYEVQEIKDDKGMYANKELDRMFKHNEWLCPIEIKQSDSAFYRPSTDSITLPLKAQFKTSATPEGIYRDGMEFYSTAIHEMTHSTGSPERLGREKGQSFGDKAYAKEELIAELSSALVGRSLGFDRQVSDNSAKYLNSWVGALKSEPRFVLSLLSDVNKATSMILGEVEKQRLALQQSPNEQQTEKRSVQQKEEPIGTITWKWSGEVMHFTDKDKYLSMIRQELDTNPSGFTVKTHSKDPYLLKAVDDLAYGLYGYDNPHPLSHYAPKENQITDATLVKLRSGDYAVRGKIDGVDTGALPITKQEAVAYMAQSSPSDKDNYLGSLINKNAANRPSSDISTEQSRSLFPKH